MRIAFLAVITTLLCLSCASARDWGEIRVGIEGDYPPFNTYDERGEIVGFDVDIALALCEAAKVRCAILHPTGDSVDITRGLMGVRGEDGKTKTLVDVAVTSMTITEERKRYFAFTAPYHNAPFAVVVKSSLSGKMKTTADFRNLRVGFVDYSGMRDYFAKLFTGADARVYYDQSELEQAMAKGEIAAMLMSAVEAYPYLKTPAGQSCCRLAGTLKPDPVLFGPGAGIAVRKADTELRDLFDHALRQIRADGTYQRIARKYFSFDVYGN